jgi:hypothetical protein
MMSFEHMVKQQLSVHSEDRDITKWPNSNHFEVELPVDYKNVASMRLNDIELPANFHVFSHRNQNTRLVFKLRDQDILVEITSGTYRPTHMALELTGQMNYAASNAFSESYNAFTVHYNEVSQKFLFVNSIETFGLDFTFPLFEDKTSCFENYAAWGLGFNLGFLKCVKYESIDTTVPFYWRNESYTGWCIESPCTIDMFGDTQVYMEVALFNSMDEIMPFTERSSSLYNSKQAGKHHSAFAKIPIGGRHAHDGDTVGHAFTNRHNLITNVFWSEPPLERIQKLKFKFRFHDGRLIDFGPSEFSFTIELTLVRSDVPKFAK